MKEHNKNDSNQTTKSDLPVIHSIETPEGHIVDIIKPENDDKPKKARIEDLHEILARLLQEDKEMK
ncbi:MAG TPA: hypothetical protein GXX18_03235 [Bacillales bacterium]|nr:hypothetical protein [Bacillales bacterium]